MYTNIMLFSPYSSFPSRLKKTIEKKIGKYFLERLTRMNFLPESSLHKISIPYSTTSPRKKYTQNTNTFLHMESKKKKIYILKMCNESLMKFQSLISDNQFVNKDLREKEYAGCLTSSGR